MNKFLSAIVFLVFQWVVLFAYNGGDALFNNKEGGENVVMDQGAMSPAQQLVQRELEMVRIDEKLGDVLDADLTFYDREGQAVNLKDYLGNKPLVLSFAYYSCTLICQFVLQGEADVFNEMALVLGKDFRAVTISFDPKDDAALTSEMSEAYGEKMLNKREGSEWTFLYGEEEEVRNITEQLGFYYSYIESSGEFAHSAAIYVITPEGKVSRYFYGIQFDPFDLELALIEAKDEQTRTTVEKILMFCYQYDSDTRGYALEAMRVMKAGGAMTVVLMGTFLVFANHKRFRFMGKK